MGILAVIIYFCFVLIGFINDYKNICSHNVCLRGFVLIFMSIVSMRWIFMQIASMRWFFIQIASIWWFFMRWFLIQIVSMRWFFIQMVNMWWFFMHILSMWWFFMRTVAFKIIFSVKRGYAYIWGTCKNVWVLRVCFSKSKSMQAKKCPRLPYFTLLN